MDSLLSRMAESAAIDRRLSAAADALHTAASSVGSRGPTGGETPPRGDARAVELDLGDDGATPPRPAARRTGPGPVSPQVRAMAAQSAARRHSAQLPSAAGGGRRLDESAATLSDADAFDPRAERHRPDAEAVRSRASTGVTGLPPRPDAGGRSGGGSATGAGHGSAGSAAYGSSRLPRPTVSAASGRGRGNDVAAGHGGPASFPAANAERPLAEAAASKDGAGDYDAAAAAPAASGRGSALLSEDEVSAALPRDVQLNLLRSQLRIAQKVGCLCPAAVSCCGDPVRTRLFRSLRRGRAMRARLGHAECCPALPATREPKRGCVRASCLACDRGAVTERFLHTSCPSCRSPTFLPHCSRPTCRR
jgi:hypothetical protein